MSGRQILRAKRRMKAKNPSRIQFHPNPLGSSSSLIDEQLQAITSENAVEQELAEDTDGPPSKLSREVSHRLNAEEEDKYQDLVKFDESVNEAIEKKNKEQLKELLSAAESADHFQRLSHKFLMCIFRNELDKIKLFVEAGLTYESLIDASHVHHHVLAMDQGHSDIAAYLIEQGADVNVTRPGTVSLAHVACRRNDHMFLQVLIANNCNIDAQCSVGLTPLMYACRYGSKECVQKLLENGVNLNLTEKVFGRSALHLAAEKKDPFVIEILQVLLDAGIDPNINDKEGQSAVAYLIKNSESTEMAFDYLIPASAKSLNQKIASSHHTVAHFAAEHARVYALQVLLQNGADFSLKDDMGRTVIHKAALSMCPEMFFYAISVPMCDVNSQDNNGDTPLHLLTTRMSYLDRMSSVWAEGVVPCLKEHGQDFNLQNKKGATPLIASLNTEYAVQISGQLVAKLIPLSNVHLKDESNKDALKYFIYHMARGSTCLMWVSNILRLFRQTGLDVAQKFMSYGSKAFVSLPTRKNEVKYFDVLKELIDIGIDVNITEDGATALLNALKFSSRVSVFLLLMANANFEKINTEQFSSLIYSSCDQILLKLIIQAGFNGRNIEPYLQRDSLDSDQESDETFTEILILIKSVPSLLQLCCRKIRNCVPSVNAASKFRALPLPPLLIDIVTFKDLIMCTNISKDDRMKIEKYS